MYALMDVERTTRRVVVPLSILAIMSLTVLSLVLAYRLLPNGGYTAPLGDFPPPEILNRVPGIEGPAAHLGEVVVLRGDRCFNRKTVTSVGVFWAPESGGPTIPGDQNLKGGTATGCMSYNINLQMPERVAPGRWAISGIVRDQSSGEVRYWTTQIVQVVP